MTADKVLGQNRQQHWTATMFHLRLVDLRVTKVFLTLKRKARDKDTGKLERIAKGTFDMSPDQGLVNSCGMKAIHT